GFLAAERLLELVLDRIADQNERAEPNPPGVLGRRFQHDLLDRNLGTEISIKQIMLKAPTENSRGIRLGSFVLIRDAIEDELEQAFSGKKSAQAALDSAVARGNRLLRQFEQANR